MTSTQADDEVRVIESVAPPARFARGWHCREIVDNVVDMAHFFYIHYAFPVYFKNVFEGHIASQHMNSKSRGDVDLGTNYSNKDDTANRSEAAYYGPSYMIDYLWSPSPL